MKIFYLINQKEYSNLSKEDIYRILTRYLGMDKVELEASEFSSKKIRKLNLILTRINLGYPEQYLYSFKYFLDTKFFVNKNVLIPRDETELMITKFFDNNKIKSEDRILDLGTGSGVIGLSIAKRYKKSKVVLSDISSSALKVAKKNSIKMKLDNIEFIKSNLFKKINYKFDYIISNPPYIDVNDLDVEKNVKKYQPSISLFAENNGLFFIESIINNLKDYLNPAGKAYIEFGWKQKDLIKKLLDSNNLYYNFYKDFSDRWRFVEISFKNESS